MSMRSISLVDVGKLKNKVKLMLNVFTIIYSARDESCKFCIQKLII